MFKIGLCCCGQLGYALLKNLSRDKKIFFVLTSAKDIEIISFCNKNEIPCFAQNPRSGRAYKFLSKNFLLDFDILFSINYLYILESDIFSLPKLNAFNIHGSLLPLYRGRCPHIWSIINGETQTGITIHKIEDGCDTGAVLLQESIAISEDISGAELLDIYFNLYPSMIRKSLDAIESGNFVLTPQDESKSSYYGARRPEDGEIDFSWNHKKCVNWIRALKRPYPGSYFFIHKYKYEILDYDSRIITKSEYLDCGVIVDIEDSFVYVSTYNSIIKILLDKKLDNKFKNYKITKEL